MKKPRRARGLQDYTTWRGYSIARVCCGQIELASSRSRVGCVPADLIIFGNKKAARFYPRGFAIETNIA
jgi:hypothetical protein